MEENTNKENQSKEDLIQQLRDSQGPGDTLVEFGPGGVNMTGENGPIPMGMFGQPPMGEPNEELVQEMVAQGKRQIDLEFQCDPGVLNASMVEAEKRLMPYFQEKMEAHQKAQQEQPKEESEG